MATQVGPKGQVVIPKEIRDKLGISAEWKVVARLVDDHVEFHFIPPEHNRSLKGVLGKYTSVRNVTDEQIRDAREQAWIEMAKAKMERNE